jgi:hypothetical protein
MARFLLVSDSCEFVDVGRSLWRDDGSVVYNCYWPSPAQSFLGPSPVGLSTIFYYLRFETFLFVASYYSQGYGGSIRPLLHTIFFCFVSYRIHFISLRWVINILSLLARIIWFLCKLLYRTRNPKFIRLLLFGFLFTLDYRGVRVRIPVWARIFSFPCRPDRFWGPPSFLSNGYRGIFPRG